jgi:hypothetical protein
MSTMNVTKAFNGVALATAAAAVFLTVPVASAGGKPAIPAKDRTPARGRASSI